MSRRRLVACSAAIVLGAMCGGAQAQGQQPMALGMYTATTVEMRAGPGNNYPVVTVLGPNLQVSVLGCVPSYEWCDVSAGGARGWVWAGLINYVTSDGTAPLRNYAPARVAVEPFVLDRYWGEHYRDRRWYGERSRWAQEERERDRRAGRDEHGRRGEPQARVQPQPPTVPPPGAPGAPPFMQHNP